MGAPSRLAAASALLLGAFGAVAVAAPAGPGGAALAPFAAFADRVHVGKPVEVDTLLVLPLWVAPEAGGGGDAAWVGLAGLDVVVEDAPEPIDEAAVGVVNPLPMPLCVPRGEVLRSPASGGVRIVDRTVWVPANGSAWLPVVTPAGPPGQGFALPVRGPYLAVEDRASPDVLHALRRGDFGLAIPERNRLLGVEPTRGADPTAGADGKEAKERLPKRVAVLEAMRARTPGLLVGVAVADEEALRSVLLEGDAGRFRALWPAVARGIALDAIARREAGARSPSPEAATRAVEQAVGAIAELRREPLTRPAYGEGEVVRWPGVEAAPARWLGLVVAGRPVTVAFHRPGPVPAPAAGGPAPPPPPPPPPPEPPGPTPPAPGPIDRDPRPTQADERWRERREGGPGMVDAGGGGAGRLR